MYAETVVIYSDLLFLINFVLDFLCLFISGSVLNCASKTRRLIFGSVFGGLYSFVPYFLTMPTIVSLVLHIFSAGLICFIGYGKRDIKKFLLLVGTFIVTSALLGGLITAIYGLSSQYNDGIYSEVDSLSFFLICIFSAVVALSYGFICKRKIHIRSVNVQIYIKDTKISANLLCDSGNLVTEPFSALPVIVLSSTCLPPPLDSPESEFFPLQGCGHEASFPCHLCNRFHSSISLQTLETSLLGERAGEL